MHIVQGSPPHTRGRLKAPAAEALRERFTPAYAGKIKNQPCIQNQSGVHPRIRGEDFSTVKLFPLTPGSPPHTRGRSHVCTQLILPPGFTPAYAGKIPQLSTLILALQVHPRIRGEDQCLYFPAVRHKGSPPHTRGRFEPLTAYLVDDRFTPAYAGKILHIKYYRSNPWVHPRIRGEDIDGTSLL